ncbi:glycine cleavage system protein T [Bowdeniella nasicola]|uniref:aminomethyltransferase n=1 Tax=Bowdeniella nasicola TaxID=208480 RepID=A0A1Q5Q2Q4_9ACTO|nr:glycine cleavage system aminomethyltransferase GcvT [Bowdeniella nasicola]OKL54124.1 glycine cleavage system protein T [Bowdeniella nasicola]
MTPDSTLLTTPLLPVHEAAGAHLIDFAGWNMPVRYTSDRVEHEAVRTAAGIFDLSHMAQISVTGERTAGGLNRCFISPMDAMSVGRAKYSMLTDASGGILDDLIVYRLADDEYLVVANASNRLVVVEELTKRCGEIDPNITVSDRTRERAIIAVQGPRSVEIMDAAGFGDATGIKYYSITPTTFDGTDVLVARTGYTGEDGFEIYLPGDKAPDAWRRLLEVGETHGLTQCGLACRDTLRLEAGMPLYGHELSTELAPGDVGMGRMVKFDHDFIGRDALADREPRYALIGLQGEGRRAARADSIVKQDGQEIGVVTSGVLSPTLGYPIALARVTLPAPAEGTELDIEVRGKSQPMIVVSPPFYTRSK